MGRDLVLACVQFRLSRPANKPNDSELRGSTAHASEIVRVVVATSHLESMWQYKQTRVAQFKQCLKVLSSGTTGATEGLFMGDLNMREEADQVIADADEQWVDGWLALGHEYEYIIYHLPLSRSVCLRVCACMYVCYDIDYMIYIYMSYIGIRMATRSTSSSTPTSKSNLSRPRYKAISARVAASSRRRRSPAGTGRDSIE